VNIFKLWNNLYQAEADGDAGSPAAAEGDAPAEGEDKGSLLSEKSTELGEGEFFLSEGIKGSGDIPEWYKPDKYKSISDQAKAHTELEKKFGAFIGAPKDGYEAPEGVDKDDALFQSLVEFGKDTNMSQEGLGKAWELLTTQSGVAEEVSQEDELAKLGDNAQERITNVSNALKFKLGEDYDKVKDLVTNADSVILAEMLIKSYAPKKLPVDGGENPTGVTRAEIEVLMQEKDSSGNLRRSTDKEFDKKITRMWTELLGDGPDVVTVG